MIKKILSVAVLLALSLSAVAQQSRICLTPYASPELKIPESARLILEQKLLQMVTQNDFGSASNEFVLTANPVVIDRQVTATAPAQHIVKLDMSFYVIGVAEQVVVDQISIEATGMGRTESRAYVAAFNQIKPRNPAVRQFLTTARDKIVDYYTTRIPAVLAKSQSMVDRGDYDGALAVLSTIPECLEEYPMVAERMSNVYVQMVDKFAAVSIQEARSKLAVRDYQGAMESLLYVDPLSTRFPEAEKMVADIKATIDAEIAAELARELEAIEYQRKQAEKAHEDEVMLRKMQIEAAYKSVDDTKAQVAADNTTTDNAPEKKADEQHTATASDTKTPDTKPETEKSTFEVVDKMLSAWLGF